MQREMESKQQLYSSLQRQLDGLQQDMQTRQAQIDQQERLAAAAKQAEERHGQLYHTYMKRALVDLNCHRLLAFLFKQLCLEHVRFLVVLAVYKIVQDSRPSIFIQALADAPTHSLMNVQK